MRSWKKFIWKITWDVHEHDIINYYPPNDFFKDIFIFGKVVEYINSYLENFHGDEYRMKHYNPENVLRNLLYVYTCDKSDELQDIYKHPFLDSPVVL